MLFLINYMTKQKAAKPPNEQKRIITNSVNLDTKQQLKISKTFNDIYIQIISNPKIMYLLDKQ